MPWLSLPGMIRCDDPVLLTFCREICLMEIRHHLSRVDLFKDLTVEQLDKIANTLLKQETIEKDEFENEFDVQVIYLGITHYFNPQKTTHAP